MESWFDCSCLKFYSVSPNFSLNCCSWELPEFLKWWTLPVLSSASASLGSSTRQHYSYVLDFTFIFNFWLRVSFLGKVCFLGKENLLSPMDWLGMSTTPGQISYSGAVSQQIMNSTVVFLFVFFSFLFWVIYSRFGAFCCCIRFLAF